MNTIQKISRDLHKKSLMQKLGMNPEENVSVAALQRQFLARSQELLARRNAENSDRKQENKPR